MPGSGAPLAGAARTSPSNAPGAVRASGTAVVTAGSSDWISCWLQKAKSARSSSARLPSASAPSAATAARAAAPSRRTRSRRMRPPPSVRETDVEVLGQDRHEVVEVRDRVARLRLSRLPREAVVAQDAHRDHPDLVDGVDVAERVVADVHGLARVEPQPRAGALVELRVRLADADLVADEDRRGVDPLQQVEQQQLLGLLDLEA